MTVMMPIKVPAGLAIRATRAIVDLDVIAGTVHAFRQLVPYPVKLMAVVKANGYGHGARMVAHAALNEGADQLAVATVQEGVVLREDGITAPILVLGPIDASEIDQAITRRLALAVGDPGRLEQIAGRADILQPAAPVAIHLKVDTGMRRYGCEPDEAAPLAQAIASKPAVRLAGVFTHFSCADEQDERPTLDQFQRFEQAITEIRERGVEPGLRHAANSAGTLRSRRFDLEMVRIGIAMYGIAPSGDIPLADGMRPAMTLVSKVGRVLRLRAGDRVSYGGTYRAERDEQAALVPIGYADGYRRALSNRGWMEICHERAPVLGRVCMDQTIVGLPDHCLVSAGEEIIVAGSGDGVAPTWDEMAAVVGTIPYEIVTGISARVPRLYVAGGELVAVEDLGGLRRLTTVG
jgi:alanine racemase